MNNVLLDKGIITPFGEISKLLYGLMGLRFSEEPELMDAAPDVLEYYIFPFTADIGEVMQDIITDEKE